MGSQVFGAQVVSVVVGQLGRREPVHISVRGVGLAGQQPFAALKYAQMIYSCIYTFFKKFF